MVIMFSKNQASLFFIQLSVWCHVFAGIPLNEHMTKVVFRGESVTLTCNKSMEHVTLIKWTRGRSLFVQFRPPSETPSIFSSHRLKIEVDFPSTLSITNVQPEDAGIYSCEVSDQHGSHNTTWNLTLRTLKRAAYWYVVYLLPPAGGLILCAVISAVCFCRTCWIRTPTIKDFYRSRTTTCVQYQVCLLEDPQAGPPQPHSSTVYRTKSDLS
ncbi:uncharacterized protein LOC114426193 [Parambassis ranga]|uniref:Uncharacterized protein LOC114426193 n=1 Tax=Parambassis ranga TaxID=210632 RepID=A0A6P7H4C2_9TELE|nr:uncharacterized protein LOC114426193 [Parambassis ranga]